MIKSIAYGMSPHVRHTILRTLLYEVHMSKKHCIEIYVCEGNIRFRHTRNPMETLFLKPL